MIDHGRQNQYAWCHIMNKEDENGVCPPDLNPEMYCFSCDKCFPTIQQMAHHVKKEHPELYEHWKATVQSWDENC